jgi:hypothetical protein
MAENIIMLCSASDTWGLAVTDESLLAGPSAHSAISYSKDLALGNARTISDLFELLFCMQD